MTPPARLARLTPPRAIWVAVVASLLVCAGITALHLRQSARLARSSALLGDLRQARIDLTRGFLALRLAGESAFRHGADEGAARLDQALVGFEEALEAQGTPGARTELQASIGPLRELLVRWRATPDPDPRLQTELLLAFAAVERQADRADELARARLLTISEQTNHEFALMLVCAVGLLSAVCAVVLLAARSHAASEAALVRARAELEHMQRLESLGRLAGGVAHDFNNLLTAIHGYGELIGARLPAGDPAHKHLEGVLGAARRAATLTAQLLAFARRQVSSRQVVRPDRLLRELEDLVGRVIGQQVRIETRAAPGLWAVRVDPRQLEQVIVNLAVNARDAMPQGGRLLFELRNVELSGDDPWVGELEAGTGEHVLVAVEDEGQGMDPETLAHAFEPFFTTKPQGKGTGLGLSMCHGIVLQNEGRIRITSATGRGTRVEMIFPRAHGELAAPSTPPPPPAAPLPPGRRVLVVEDDPAVRLLTVESLSAAGLTVLEADCGPAALTLLEQGQTVDLLLTDLAMPGMTGQELARRFRELRPGVPVLYMSGYSGSELNATELQSLIPKPFDTRQLIARIRAAIEGAPAG